MTRTAENNGRRPEITEKEEESRGEGERKKQNEGGARREATAAISAYVLLRLGPRLIRYSDALAQSTYRRYISVGIENKVEKIETSRRKMLSGLTGETPRSSCKQDFVKCG